jgi:glutathione S-transferase
MVTTNSQPINEERVIMTTENQLELISFDLCPFVQRSVIILMYKKMPYDITFIDLSNPPEWFAEISPLGKVPVMKVKNRGKISAKGSISTPSPFKVLFESAVINEYIDETVGAPLLASDPLDRAFERAWIAYGSELFMSHHHMVGVSDASTLKNVVSEFFDDLSRLEKILPADGVTFNGKTFSLVDAAYAPLFFRMALSEKLQNHSRWESIPRTRRWAQSLCHDSIVKESVIPDFNKKYIQLCKAHGTLLYP